MITRRHSGCAMPRGGGRIGGAELADSGYSGKQLGEELARRRTTRIAELRQTFTLD